MCFYLFATQLKLNGRKSNHGPCTASSILNRSRRFTTRAYPRSRWRLAEWRDDRWSLATGRGDPAEGARWDSRAERIPWTGSWTIRRVSMPTRRPWAISPIRTWTRCPRVPSTTIEFQWAGTEIGTRTGSRKLWTWLCPPPPCGTKIPPTTTLTPATTRTRITRTGTPAARPGISPTIGNRVNWVRCSGRGRVTRPSSKPARRAWTEKTWTRSIIIGRPVPGLVIVIITGWGPRLRSPIERILLGRARGSLFSADHLPIRTRWSENSEGFGDLDLVDVWLVVRVHSIALLSGGQFLQLR